MSKFGNKCQNDVWVYKSKYVLKISLISFFLRDSYRLSLISSILQKKKAIRCQNFKHFGCSVLISISLYTFCTFHSPMLVCASSFDTTSENPHLIRPRKYELGNLMKQNKGMQKVKWWISVDYVCSSFTSKWQSYKCVSY